MSQVDDAAVHPRSSTYDGAPKLAWRRQTIPVIASDSWSSSGRNQRMLLFIARYVQAVKAVEPHKLLKGVFTRQPAAQERLFNRFVLMIVTKSTIGALEFVLITVQFVLREQTFIYLSLLGAAVPCTTSLFYFILNFKPCKTWKKQTGAEAVIGIASLILKWSSFQSSDQLSLYLL